ncbi:MAG: hypothetical protein GX577_11800 [Leptolinea sp.]|nr:hypothetical protein [Leptolinea sp.]
MAETKKFSLVKPTIDTPFHIDFDWWKSHDGNWRIYLQSCLCSEHQAVFENLEESSSIDWVDPITAEVHVVDGLQDTLMSHCAKLPDFLTNHTTLVDAVFRVLVSRGNTGMSPTQLAEIIGKPAETILRTIGGVQVYKGLRPIV